MNRLLMRMALALFALTIIVPNGRGEVEDDNRAEKAGAQRP